MAVASRLLGAIEKIGVVMLETWNRFIRNGYHTEGCSIERADVRLSKGSNVYGYAVDVLGFGRPVRTVQAEVTYELPNKRYVTVTLNLHEDDEPENIESMFERTYETLLNCCNVCPDIALG